MRLRDLAKSKSVNAQAFFNILGPVILNGVSFFTVPIFTRMLGPANFGIVSLYTTWVQFFTILSGMQTSGTIATAVVYFDAEEQKRYRSSILTLSFTSFLLVSAVMLVIAGPFGAFTGFSRTTITLIILQSFGAYCINFAVASYIYDKQAFRNFLVSVITSLSMIALSPVLIFFVYTGEDNYRGRILGMALPNVVIGGFLFISFLNAGRTGINRRFWRFCIPLAIPLVFHGLSQIVLSQTSKVMLQQYYDESVVGIYALIVTVTSILGVIYNALNNTFVPFYFDYLKEDRRTKLHESARNYIFLFTGIVMGFIMVSPEVIKLFAGQAYWDGIPLLPILAFGTYMTFLYSFPVNYQFYRRKTVNIAIGTFMAAVLNILLNLLLIPRYGMFGAAISTAVAYIALFAFHETIAKRLGEGDYPFGLRTYWWSILAVVSACGLFYLLQDRFIIRWAIGLLLGSILLHRVIKKRLFFRLYARIDGS